MNQIVKITAENPTYTSIVPVSKEQAKILYNAKENPSARLSEFINKRIKFTDVFMEMADVMEKDENGNPTGVVNSTVKTILITPDGKGILTTSMGVARSLYSMFQIFGTPDTWEEPMECEVKQIDIGKNRTFKLEIC